MRFMMRNNYHHMKYMKDVWCEYWMFFAFEPNVFTPFFGADKVDEEKNVSQQSA